MISSIHDVQRAVRRFRSHLTAPGSPVRHLRRAASRALHPVKVRERREAGKRLQEKLSPELAETVETLRREGIASFDAHVDKALLAELDAYYRNVLLPRAQEAQGTKTHPFFFPLSRPEDLSSDNIIVRFALQDQALAAMAAYLGTAPFFQSVKIIESRGIKQDKFEASQLWHLDYSDSKSVWLWVYLTDVLTDDDGPYTYLPVSASKQVRNSLFPRRIMDEEIDDSPLGAQVKKFMGPRLTTFLVDSTSIYHMGSRLPEGRKRAIYHSGFVDPVFNHSMIKPVATLPGDRRFLFTR